MPSIDAILAAGKPPAPLFGIEDDHPFFTVVDFGDSRNVLWKWDRTLAGRSPTC